LLSSFVRWGFTPPTDREMQPKSHTETVVQYLKEQLADAEWVLAIREYDGDEYDVMIDTNVRFISYNHRLHTLTNVGVDVVSFSDHAPNGFRLYGNLR